MHLTDPYIRLGSGLKRHRSRPVYGFFRAALRQKWVQATGALALLGLIAWFDASPGYLTGIRLLYILPIWLGIRIAGPVMGLLGALVVSVLMGQVDAASAGTDRNMLLQNDVARFLSFTVVALVIAHIERRLSDASLLATRDPLTGVLNRTELRSKVENAIRNARYTNRELAFALVDCNRFKEVNDRRGHAFGDRALRTLAKTLQNVGLNEGFVGRMGGDEFGVFFDGVPEGCARDRMERAGRSFASHMRALGCETTVSFGLVAGNSEPLTFQLLLEAADHQMYVRKRNDALESGRENVAAEPLLSSSTGAYQESGSQFQANRDAS